MTNREPDSVKEPSQASDSESRRTVFITVAICTRNREHFLAAACRSVMEQLGPAAELLIVDNASTDGTARIAQGLRTQNPRVRVVQESQAGISHARNRALREALGEYIVFFDDDELAEPGWLLAYIDFFRHPPSAMIGSVGGPCISEYEVPPPSWLTPTHGGFDLGGERRVLQGVVGPGAGNCGYCRQAVIAVGGFDPALIRCEDSELNWRLREAGYEVWWLPEARIRHRIPASLFSMRKQLRTAFMEGRSVTLFRLRATPRRPERLAFILARLTSPALAALQALAAALCLTVGKRRASFRVLSRAFRNVGIFTELLLRLVTRSAVGPQLRPPESTRC